MSRTGHFWGMTMTEIKKGGRPPKVSREEIVDAALRVGLDSATVRTIAEELNVTSMTIYNHFGNIDEIIDHCIMSIVTDIIDKLNDLDTFEDTLKIISLRYFDLLCGNHVVILRVIGGNIFPAGTTACVDTLISYGTARDLTPGEALFALRSVIHAAVGCAVTSMSVRETAAPWIDPESEKRLDAGEAAELGNLDQALRDKTLNVFDPLAGINMVLEGLRAMFGDRMTAPASIKVAAVANST